MYEEAISTYHRAIHAKTDFADAYLNLGNVLREKGEAEYAVDSYMKAIEFNPHFADAYLSLGLVMNELGDVQEAIACYQKSIELKSDFVDSYLSLGLAKNELGEAEEAIAYFKQAIHLKPDFAKAKQALMQCQGENGIREQVSVESYREQIEGKSEVGILIASYPSFDAIPPTRRSVNSWTVDKQDSYFSGAIFSSTFVDRPWVGADSAVSSSAIELPEAGPAFLDAVDLFQAKNQALQIRYSQATVVCALLDGLARRLSKEIDVVDVGGWGGNALFCQAGTIRGMLCALGRLLKRRLAVWLHVISCLACLKGCQKDQAVNVI